jgi:hypothetical protein
MDQFVVWSREFSTNLGPAEGDNYEGSITPRVE